MEKSKISELIFEKWSSTLKSKDRSKDAVADNFDELFGDLKSANVSFEEAHLLLSLAIKAHQPSSQAKKNTWNKYKTYLNVTENEFYTEWHDSIKAKGTESFYEHFPLKSKSDEDDEPKIFGSMSAKEYKLQKKHANSFPIVDTVELVKRMKERNYIAVDVENILGEKK